MKSSPLHVIVEGILSYALFGIYKLHLTLCIFKSVIVIRIVML